MTAYVFLGPSLPLQEARTILPEAVFLPPARQGDIWRITEFGKPRVIGLVDGYFECVPSVWHKEILWALSQRIAVAGASSMGALRAAELDQFGMVGIGRVYEAYRDGSLPPYGNDVFEDDDEVAIVHGPPEFGYLASEAMVNIRCTLARAEEDGVVSSSARDALVRIAKGLFYKDRSYSALLQRAEKASALASAVSALRSWLPSGRVDQKRDDARDLLYWIKRNYDHQPEARFRFEPTTMWRHLIDETCRNPSDELVLREFRISGEPYLRRRDEIVAELTHRILGQSELASPPNSSTPIAIVAGGDSAMPQAAVAGRTLSQIAPLIDIALLTRLKSEGGYEVLLARAERKKRRLAAVDPEESTSHALSPPVGRLFDWFSPRMGEHTGDSIGTAALLAFASEDDFLSALADEYIFVRIGDGNAASE
jgi:hypothetical protein